MSIRTTISKATITRAIEAFTDACGPVGAIEVMPDGRLRIERVAEKKPIAGVDAWPDAQHDTRKPKPWGTDAP